jgi:hypothetical protein
MKNTDNLLLLADVFAGLFIGLSHLVPALNAFNDINIILTPHGEGILRLTLRANRPGNKTLAH